MNNSATAKPNAEKMLSYRGLRFQTTDHIRLAADAWGDPAKPPVILLHGGGQTRHSWKNAAKALAVQGFYALAVDLRGHGDSGWSPDGVYSSDLFCSDLRFIAATLASKPAVVGASLGGGTALLAEGEGPSFLSALVLVDVTPTVQLSSVDKIRGFMSARLKDGFASIEEAADAIATYLPHRHRRRNLDSLRKNLRLCPDGRYHWHWDPALIDFGDKHVNESLSIRMTAAARQLRLPVLLVRGGASELVSNADARDFLKIVPSASYVDIRGAGHMVAGDVNDSFTYAVVSFLMKLQLAPQNSRAR